MKPVTAMAAQFTDVTLGDMETLLSRSFHSLHQKKGAIKGELVVDLYFSPKVGTRVWTSIGQNQTSGADVGDDAIRVQLYNFEKNMPLMRGKAPIVKRTQGWKDNLRERIEENLERFYEKEEDIEAGKFIDWSK